MFTVEELDALAVARRWLLHLYLNRKIVVTPADVKQIDVALPHLGSAISKAQAKADILS